MRERDSQRDDKHFIHKQINSPARFSCGICMYVFFFLLLPHKHTHTQIHFRQQRWNYLMSLGKFIAFYGRSEMKKYWKSSLSLSSYQVNYSPCYHHQHHHAKAIFFSQTSSFFFPPPTFEWKLMFLFDCNQLLRVHLKCVLHPLIMWEKCWFEFNISFPLRSCVNSIDKAEWNSSINRLIDWLMNESESLKNFILKEKFSLSLTHWGVRADEKRGRKIDFFSLSLSCESFKRSCARVMREREIYSCVCTNFERRHLWGALKYCDEWRAKVDLNIL